MRYFRLLFKGITCGGVGGVTAGSLLGIIYALIGGDQYIEAWPVFLWTGAWAGLVVGSLAGGVVGLTVPVTEAYLNRVSQATGVTIVVTISIILPYSVEIDQWTRVVVGVVIGSALGLLSGTIAFRCYLGVSNNRP
jgi:hypothetical protein